MFSLACVCSWGVGEGAGLGYLWSQVPSWSLVKCPFGWRVEYVWSHVLSWGAVGYLWSRVPCGGGYTLPSRYPATWIPYHLDTPPHTHTKAGGAHPNGMLSYLPCEFTEGFYVFSGEALSTVRVHRGGAPAEAGRVHQAPGLLLPVPHALARRWSHHHTGVTERRVLQRYLHERE